MSVITDLDTIPWVPHMAPDALGTCEQADVLATVRREARISTSEAAAILGIDAVTVECLRLVWRATPALRELIRGGSIATYPAGLLAKLEQYTKGESLELARGYIRGLVTLRALEDRLVQCQREILLQRSKRKLRFGLRRR